MRERNSSPEIRDARRTDAMEKKLDLLCVGTAIADCIIKGFDPEPVSAAGFRAESCSINPGGEGLNESVTAAKLGLKTGILCFLGCDGAGDLLYGSMASNGVDMSYAIRENINPRLLRLCS